MDEQMTETIEIKPLKNPVCDKCIAYRPQGAYQWACLDCKTIYRAEKWTKDGEAWFEHKPYGHLIVWPEDELLETPNAKV
jgi:hypothetical protein